MPVTITRGSDILPPDGDGPHRGADGMGTIGHVVYGDTNCTIEIYGMCPVRFRVSGVIALEDIPVVFGVFSMIAPNSKPGDSARLPYED